MPRTILTYLYEGVPRAAEVLSWQTLPMAAPPSILRPNAPQQVGIALLAVVAHLRSDGNCVPQCVMIDENCTIEETPGTP